MHERILSFGAVVVKPSMVRSAVISAKYANSSKMNQYQDPAHTQVSNLLLPLEDAGSHAPPG